MAPGSELSPSAWACDFPCVSRDSSWFSGFVLLLDCVPSCCCSYQGVPSGAPQSAQIRNAFRRGRRSGNIQNCVDLRRSVSISHSHVWGEHSEIPTRVDHSQPHSRNQISSRTIPFARFSISIRSVANGHPDQSSRASHKTLHITRPPECGEVSAKFVEINSVCAHPC